jgi:hypothetical protein
MPRFAPHGWIRQILPLLYVNDGGVIVETFTNPLAAVANRLVTTTAMKVGLYTVANSGISADGYAHPVTLARTLAGTSLDTAGTVLFTGLDNAGNTITDTLTPGTSTTTVYGTKAFKSVSSIEGIGWVINPDGTSTADTIVCGFGADLGLSHAASADADILTVYDAASLAATASFDGDADGTVSGTFFTPTGANGTLDYTVVYHPVQSSVLTGTSAAVLQTCAALGYEVEVEAFYFVARDALVGASAAQSFTLKNGTHTICTLALAAAVAGSTTSTVAADISASYMALGDADYLVLSRVVSGTAFDSGSGQFFVRLRQRTQRDR